MQKLKVAIIGASGYTGGELIRLLIGHPQVELTMLVSESYAGQAISHSFAHLARYGHLHFEALDLAKLVTTCKVAFLAMPSGEAIKLAPQLYQAGLTVIDLSADFRLRERSEYLTWYQHEPAPAAILSQAVYGLSEIGYREQLRSARLIANPGCYPTATLLALAPLITNRLVQVGYPIIIDAKSGVSGAGRSLSLNSHFCEVNESLSVYQAGGTHRHTPEIRQELTKLNGATLSIQFTPHLLPISRGLMATCYAQVMPGVTAAMLTDAFRQYYANSDVVKYITTDRPRLSQVIGSNYCHLSSFFDPTTQIVTVVSLIDNLLKGAAGQAVQNMNLSLGFEPTLGLDAVAIFP
jgi:N-acetyl-gamma-glutamyl-phosphate reductase